MSDQEKLARWMHATFNELLPVIGYEPEYEHSYDELPERVRNGYYLLAGRLLTDPPDCLVAPSVLIRP